MEDADQLTTSKELPYILRKLESGRVLIVYPPDHLLERCRNRSWFLVILWRRRLTAG